MKISKKLVLESFAFLDVDQSTLNKLYSSFESKSSLFQRSGQSKLMRFFVAYLEDVREEGSGSDPTSTSPRDRPTTQTISDFTFTKVLGKGSFGKVGEV